MRHRLKWAWNILALRLALLALRVYINRPHDLASDGEVDDAMKVIRRLKSWTPNPIFPGGLPKIFKRRLRVYWSWSVPITTRPHDRRS